MFRQPYRIATALAAMVALASPIAANASLTFSTTRVIFQGHEREAGIRAQNGSDVPALVQAWIDDGDRAASPANAKSPFILRPPIFRVDGGRSQVLRIVLAGQAPRQDRESLFWLNAREIPATTKSDDQAGDDAVLTLAVRTRLKLFYRPKGLTATAAAKAPAQLKWQVVSEGTQRFLQATNGTPFHVNVIKVTAGGGNLDPDGKPIAPFSAQRYELAGAQRTALPQKVTFEYVNDHGGVEALSAPLIVN